MNKILRTLIVLLISLIAAPGLHAQDSLEQKVDSLKTKIVELTDVLSQIKKRLTEDKENKEPAFVITLHDSNLLKPVQTFNNDEDTLAKVIVEKVIFDIKDGLILDLQVLCKNGKIYSNYHAPIALTRFDRCAWLSYHNGKRFEYIRTCDIARVIRKGISVPDDSLFELTAKAPEFILMRGAGINQVVDLRIYSDMLGTFGNEANGIAQVEGSTRIFINNRNWFGRSFTPFRYGFFSVQASKLDSRLQTLAIDTTFSRLDVIQRSFAGVDIGTNLFGFWLQRKSRSWASVNGGAGIHLTRSGNEGDTTTMTSQYLFLESLFEFKEIRNFGVDFSARVFWQTIPGLPDNTGNTQSIFRLGATAYWNPVGNVGSRIFARVNYYQNLDNGEQPFVQLQIGYSAMISSLLSKK